NFFYFAVFQCTLAGTLRWLSGRWSVALFGVGLLLTATTPYSGCGDLTDFRIDFIAFCLFGTFICFVVRSRFFASMPLAMVAGAAAALLFLFRFLTIVYVTGIFGAYFLGLCLGLYVRRHDRAARKTLGRQFMGLLSAGGIVAVVAIPVLSS